MEFLPKDIDEYTGQFTAPESEVLAELNRETHAKVLQPRMLSGHVQGRILATFSHMIRPRRVLEIGTYTGYSAICLAEGLSADGLVHSIDNNEELESMARDYFNKAGVNAKIKLHIGDALTVIPKLNEKWDLVFIDADKENYSRYFDQVIDQVREGGFIIADNVLWSGKVLKEATEKDMDTKALREFNEKVHRNKRVENVLFPVRDGLMVCRKK